MSVQDSRQRPPIQLWASQLVNKFSTVLLRTDASTNPNIFKSRMSMDIPRKPFVSTSQPELARYDQGSPNDRVHTTSSTRLPESGHKKGLSMPVWTPPQTPPGIVVTQPHSDACTFPSPASTPPDSNSAVDSPSMRSPWLAPWTPRTTPGPGPTAIPSSSISPMALPSPAVSLPPASSLSTAPPPPTLLAPWTPRTTPGPGPTAIPSSSISPMALPSPAVSLPPASSLSAAPAPSTSLPSPEPINCRRSPAPYVPAAGISLVSQPSITPSRRESLDKQPHALRLSPTIIQRVPPWPIKDLPTISISQGQLGRREDPPTRALLPGRTSSTPPHPDTTGPGPMRGPSLGPSFVLRRPSPSRLSTMPALPMSGSERPQLRDETCPAYTAPGQCISPQHDPDPDPDPAHDMDEDEMDEMEHEDYVAARRGTSMDSTQTEREGGYGPHRPSMESIEESGVPENPGSWNTLDEIASIPFNVESFGWGEATPHARPQASSSTSASHALQAPTPRVVPPRSESGYFNFQPHHPYVTANACTPRPGDFSGCPAARSGVPAVPLHPTPTMPPKCRPTPLEPGRHRKASYHHPSQSMINLTVPPPKTAPLPTPETESDVAPGSPTGEGKGKGRETGPHDGAHAAHRNKSIKRRQSMPSMTAVPPAYSPVQRRFPAPSQARVFPRDEEGREPLPEYSNEILLISQMPRKVEFTRPGVMSRDRKWRRVWCVLEGTKFAVYKVKGVKSVWECVVGTGDGTVHKTSPGKGKDEELEAELGRIRKVEGESRDLVEGDLRSSSSWRSGVSGYSPTSSTLLSPPSDSPPLTRSSSSNVSLRSSAGDSSQPPFTISRPISHRSASTSSSTSKAGQDRPHPSCLLREYTLQNAESGLGSDYTKRQNVIRVRMEGEQFLLQAKDVEDVVEWIEGLQAATNVALDLDERLMPRGPLFPRRRRRRRQLLADDSASAPAAVAADRTSS